MILARRPRLFARPPPLPRGSALTRAGCAQTVATAVFMEMNRGSLNPLFARRPRRLHLLHRLYPATSTWGSTPAWTFSTWLPRASAVRPCRFALYSLPPCLRSSPVPLYTPFLSRRQPSSSRFPRLACGRNPRAQLLPLFAHLITRNS